MLRNKGQERLFTIELKKGPWVYYCQGP